MTHQEIRQLLCVPNRSHTHLPGKWLFGPTGARLWIDYIDAAPGFSGRVDFIHKINLPLLFTVTVNGKHPDSLHASSIWYPDEMTVHFEDAQWRMDERKTITWDDCAVSMQTWANLSNQPLHLQLCLPDNTAPGHIVAFPTCAHSISPIMLCTATGLDPYGAATLLPGKSVQLLIVAALALQGEEALLFPRITRILHLGSPEIVLNELSQNYMAWFDNAPSFSCSDPALTTCWYYRLYLLRKNLARPGIGTLPLRTFYEGRAHTMDKTPHMPSKSWEFSRLIPLSTPLHITDARWLKDTSIASDALTTLCHALDENGIFAVTAIDSIQKEYANYASWALYLWYQVSGDLDAVKKLLPAFKKDVLSVFQRTGCAVDALQIEHTHALTGKEYQPSYWYFGKDCFPRCVRPAEEGYTPLKRIDRSIYSFLNFSGLSKLCKLVGDEDAMTFERTTQQIKHDILTKMWDEPSGFFYDLHYQTDAKAYVKNIVAFYPFWVGITKEEHLRSFDYLLSEDYFALGSGFASVAKDCPVFSPDGGWRGDYIKGRDGCMWNGSSWPYTTGITLDALARQSKEHEHRYDLAFTEKLREYTLEHFQGYDPHRPFLVEFYHSETGEPLSHEPDYNHSFYIDLIIRHLAGLEPNDSVLTFHPIHTNLQHMTLSNLYIHGQRIDVTLASSCTSRMYTVSVNEQVVYQGNGDHAIQIVHWANSN